jgi:hypothetical protein
MPGPTPCAGSAPRSTADTRSNPARIRSHAEQFSQERFLTAMTAEIDALVDAPAGEAARW